MELITDWSGKKDLSKGQIIVSSNKNILVKFLNYFNKNYNNILKMKDLLSIKNKVFIITGAHQALENFGKFFRIGWCRLRNNKKKTKKSKSIKT